MDIILRLIEEYGEACYKCGDYQSVRNAETCELVKAALIGAIKSEIWNASEDY